MTHAVHVWRHQHEPRARSAHVLRFSIVGSITTQAGQKHSQCVADRGLLLIT